MKTHLSVMKNFRTKLIDLQKKLSNWLLFIESNSKNPIKSDQTTIRFRKNVISVAVFTFLILAIVDFSSAQVNISAGNTVSENFDGMGATATATLPSGWKIDKNTTVRLVGSYASAGTATERTDGTNMISTAGNGIYNFGTGASGAGTDRALGGLSSSSSSKSVNTYVDFYNNGAGSITGLTISFDVEKYRKGSNAAGFRIQMYYSTDGSSWTDAGAAFSGSFSVDPDNTGYAIVPGATASVTLQSLAQVIPAGTHIYLAWNFSVISASTTSNAQALGIDNVVVTAVGAAPLITLSTNSIADFGSVQVSSSSAEAMYTVSGSDLTDTLHITAPAPFEISLTSGSGFGSSAYLLPSSGTVANTTIYARFSPTANGAVSDSISHISAGATTQKVGLSGTGSSCTAPNITAGGPTTICAGDSVLLTADPGVSYLWSNGETTQSIYAKIAGNYSVAVTDGSSCTATSIPTTISVNTFSYSGVVFSENMGSPSATTFVNAYTGWQNNGILTFQTTTTTASDVRTTTASSGYAGASGYGNIWMGTATSSARDFIIANINTAGYTGLTMTFGLLRSSNTDNIVVSVSTDGVTYTPVTTSAQPPTNNVWALVTVSTGIPAASNLRIKFEKNTGNSFRIDDITLNGTASAVSISASGTTTICNGSYVTLTSNIPNGNEWSPVFAFSQSIQASAAGSYTVTVTDLNNCSLTSTPIVVSVVAAPSATTSTTDALCAGDSTGTATAVGSGGAGGYTYSWDSSPIQTTDIATGLPAGTYTVTVTDLGGCTGTSSATVGEPLPLQVITSSTVPSTIGGSDGTATAFAYDGTGPYTYSWNSAPVQNTDVATGLTAGTYIVVATDFNGCTASATEVVVDPIPEITVVTAIPTLLPDFGSVIVGNSSAEDIYSVSAIYLTDSLLISASTGFEVSLSSGFGFGPNVTLYPSLGVVGSTNIYARFTPVGLGAVSGNIAHTSTGASQKDVAVSGTGISCAQPTITVSGPTTFCAGDSVTLTSSAGNSYLWSNGATTQSIVVLTSGSYSVTVTDAFACAATSSAEVVTVNMFTFTGAVFSENMGTPGSNTFVNSYTGWENQGATFQSTLTNQSDVRTSSSSSGYTGASGSGNVFMGTAGFTNPRDFIISGINTVGYTGLNLSFGMSRTSPSEDLIVSVSTDGITYSPITTTSQPTTSGWALVTDSLGIIPATSNLHIKFEKTTSVSFRIDDIIISGTTNSLIVTANGPTTICSGKTLVLTSNISAGNFWSPNAELSQSINVTSSGTYYSVVTDLNGCSETSASFTVSVNPSPAVDTLIGTNLLCNNDSSGTATATISGGTAPFIYNWNSLPPQTATTATGLKAGYYVFTVTDDNACTASAGLLITQPSVLNVTASVISHPSSIGASDGSIASAASGGTTPYTYSWNSAPMQTTDTATNLMAGIYTVTVVDSNGCSVSATDTLKDPLPEIFVSTNTIPDFGNVLVGNSSVEAIYNVSGINLTDSILITAPPEFEISLTSGSGFGFTVTLYHTLGTVTATDIYVRFSPTGGGFFSGDIIHASTGATQRDVAVSGTGVTCSQATITPSGPLSFCAGGNVTLTASAGSTFLWSDGQTSQSIFVDTAGTWTVVVTDAFSCSSTTAPTTVTVNTFAFIGDIFVEDMGNSGGTTALNTYTGWANYGTHGFSTNPVGPSDVRTSSGSSGYSGSSGFSNVFMGTAGSINPRNFIISGINTVGYTGMQLSFGMHRTGTTENLVVAVSSDGISYTALTTSAQPTPANTWGLVTATGAIPNTTTLYIKFSKLTNVSFRVDDVKLSGTVYGPEITPNGPVSICQGSQLVLSSNVPVGNFWTQGLETLPSIVVSAGGTYGLIVTDMNGCTASAPPVSVSVDPIPVVSTTSTDVSCNGGNDGTATANVTAGTAPFTYSWNTAPVQTGQTATGLAAGTYTVVVTGFLGCQNSATVTVLEPALLQATCSGTDISCNGLTDGTANVTESGGTGPYTYSWTSATPTTVSVDLTPIKDNNIFADNTGNSNATGPNFVAGNNGSGFARRALLAFDIASNIPSGATITGATLNLNMSHTSGGAGAQDFDLHQMLTNWGEATSFDAGNPGDGVPATPGFPGDATWIFYDFPLYPWNTSGGDFNPTISATTTVDAIGQYLWSGPSMVADVQNWLNNPLTDFGWILKGQESGPTQAKRFDSRENTTPANRPTLSVTYTIPTVVGTTSGLTGLGAGTYTAVVTDFNGCTSSCDVTVNEPSAIVANCTVLNHVTCNGGSDGAVSVSGSGGTGAITVSGPATSLLTAGSYTYTLTDANGCSTSCVLVITEPAAIVISGFIPNSGPTGTVVTISGSGFTGATDVQFNGVSGSYTVDNDGQITATVPGLATTGPITVIVGSCQVTSTGNFTVGSGSLTLDLTCFLEGFYLGGGVMNTTLYDLEQGAVLPGPYPSTATDSIEVNLWSQNAVTTTMVPDYTEKVILHNNGTASINFPTATGGYYYIAVRHKNSLETWSKDSVLFSLGPNSYNFSTAQTRAFDDGFNLEPMKNMGGGVFAFYSGDVNQDGTIDGPDLTEVFIDNNLFLYDYLDTDCTGDGTADGPDLTIVFINNNLFLFYARPY